MITLRAARMDDAAAIAALLRRSITELCEPDHKNDPAEVAAWTANKTPEAVAVWIDHDGLSLIAAYAGDALSGVGAVSNEGEVLLLYVHPEHCFAGVSDALLRHMVSECGASHLTSTFTARDFYCRRGWQETGEPSADGVPMRLLG